MAGLLIEPRKRGSRSSAMSRRYPGGTLKLIGAKSPSGFRSTSAPIVLQDEIDSFVPIKEGDPVALGDRAAITFPNAWKGKSSTPTLAGISKIETGFKRGDQQRYFVPCVHCGAFQWLKTEQLKFSFTAEEAAFAGPPGERTWEIGTFPLIDTARALYVCEECHRGWTDFQRVQAIQSGHESNPAVNGKRAQWRATAPFAGIRSRAMNGMYQTMGLKPGFANYLQQFAEDFLAAKRGGRETLMVWTNLFKAETFEETTEKVDWQLIRDRAEVYPAELPDQALWLVASGDVQRDRVEILILGFGEGQECWALDYHVVYGDFDNEETQKSVVSYVLNRRFTHSVLGEVKVKAFALDSGHQTKVHAVYKVCSEHTLENFWAVKGSAQQMVGIFAPFKDRRYRCKGFTLNTDLLKSMIFDRLRMAEPGDRYIHFPKCKMMEGSDPAGISLAPDQPSQWKRFDAAFYQQLCSERRFAERDKKTGQVSYIWKKISQSARNEVLDLMVYAFGAFEICRPEVEISRTWKEIGQNIRGKAEAPEEDKNRFLSPQAHPPISPPIPRHQPRPRATREREPQFQGRGTWNPLGV
jgi:phage terminase large subunit GpA-like protein